MVLRPSSSCAIVALFAALLVPAVASASPGEDKVVSSTETFSSAAFVFRSFTVKSGAKLRATPYSIDGGWIKITANTITVDGTIEANGVGFPGHDKAAGDAPPSTNGGGSVGGADGYPGGGGAFFGAGAGGTDANCNLLTPGGTPFFVSTPPTPNLGAAGGAANVTGGGTMGGAGGGAIILSAAKIVINGTVSADGASPSFAIGGVGAGGGAGGTIKLYAAILEGNGILSAKGGDGLHGIGTPKIAANNGGGGGGGVIILSLPLAAPALTVTTQVGGGATGDCTGHAPDGAVVHDALPGDCVDLDADQSNSNLCGGPDCDDTDDSIHPGAERVCNGEDNDCDGAKDTGVDLCEEGRVCQDGKCVVVDAGAPSDAGAGGAGGAGEGMPDHIEFRGGCALPAHSGLPEGALGAVAFALGAFALGASRRRRPWR